MAKKTEVQIPKAAAEAGLRLARRVFETRGNHSEIHLGEEELAVILSAAFQLGGDSYRTALQLIAETPRSAPSVPQDIVRVRRIAADALRVGAE